MAIEVTVEREQLKIWIWGNLVPEALGSLAWGWELVPFARAYAYA